MGTRHICPDINSLPKLAEIFDISVGELMRVKTDSKNVKKKDISPLIDLIFRAVALAMGVSVVVLSSMNELDANSAMGMLGIGIACLAISSFTKKDGE